MNMDKNFLYRLIQTQQFDNIANQSSGSKMPRADWNLISNSEFVERFPELSLFFKAYSPLDSEMICIFPYFCPYAESAREIREIFS